jgi:hypothetical protein
VGWTGLQPKDFESLVAALGTPTLLRDYVLISKDQFDAAVAAAEYKESEAAEAPMVPFTPLGQGAMRVAQKGGAALLRACAG